MARITYKGFDLPDGAAIPDVPSDLRTLVDGIDTKIVHPRGVTAAGTLQGAPAINAIVNMTGQSGALPWVANNMVTIPVGAGGLYLVTLVGYMQATAIVGIGLEVRNSAGSAVAPGIRVGVAAVLSSAGYWVGATHVRQVNDGDTYRVHYTGNTIAAGQGAVQVVHFGFARLGDALATA